jgi:3D (Asp-Asp-Asp) domain-containing protein
MNLILAIMLISQMLPTAMQPKVRTVEAVVTAYCPCKLCCGPDARGITSTGQDARDLSGCAVDPKLIPYGCRVYVPAVGWRTADDTGSAMRDDGRRGVVHIDVRMRTHQEALQFGLRRAKIKILEQDNPPIVSSPGVKQRQLTPSRDTIAAARLQTAQTLHPKKLS